jgi:hypothetical protein
MSRTGFLQQHEVISYSQRTQIKHGYGRPIPFLESVIVIYTKTSNSHFDHKMY